jgi:hypothetical protein
MMRRVVDTNVPVVANGRDSNATPGCRQACLVELRDILHQGRIIVDDAGEMLADYRRYLSPSGQPGVGDLFFREILTNFAGKVERIPLERRSDGSFMDFPGDPRLATFDVNDRKFAAASRRTGVPVCNATDTDWLVHRAALAENGIEVVFLCGCNPGEWFAS